MQGHSPALMDAAARFADTLPVDSSLAELAENVLAEIQREIDAVDAEIRRFSDVDVPLRLALTRRWSSARERGERSKRIAPDGAR